MEIDANKNAVFGYHYTNGSHWIYIGIWKFVCGSYHMFYYNKS